jgi:DNA polymerase
MPGRRHPAAAAPDGVSDSPGSDRITDLAALGAAEQACRRCPLYRDATQAVPGHGSLRSRVMLVGEQPGDKEDIAGVPFVGPAGRVLDRALAEAGIDRKTAFVTNAVKHFKHELRGKKRLHKRPNGHEIERCRWWLDLERAIVRPKLLVALGATAAWSILGRQVTITSLRGAPQRCPDGTPLVVTVHPSSILRSQDDEERAAKYEAFVADLRIAAALLKRRA